MSCTHIAVIGGGITGLTAAYELIKKYEAAGQSVQITIIEQSARLGGAIQTIHREGFLIEKGPDSFLARKPSVLRLSQELGLSKDWVGMNPAGMKSFIYLNGALHPMPEGLSMGIPTKLGPLVRTPLLSVAGKARAALDLLLPRKGGAEDESLGSLVSRRLGKEVAEHLVGPVLGGIYAGDLDQLSTAATFPQLRELEHEHRSLILGMLAARSKRAAGPGAGANGATGAGGAPGPNRQGSLLPKELQGSMFLSFRDGLRSLVDRLAESIAKRGARLLLSRSVSSLVRQSDGYQLRLSDGSGFRVDGVVLAVPAEQALPLVAEDSEVLRTGLSQIPSVSVANVVMALDPRKLRMAPRGSGFVVPRSQNLPITACTWTSNKWSHTAPKDKLLLRAYVGHWGDQTHERLDDGELAGAVRGSMASILGQSFQPLFTVVTRHRQAMSQYLTGHTERCLRMEDELSRHWPGLVVAGRSYRGVGIPDCISQGEQAAGHLYKQLRECSQGDR